MLITDVTADRIETLRTLPHEQRASCLIDASAIYEYVKQNEWGQEADLRSWGEGVGFDPDRLTRALAVLREAGLVYELPGSAILPPPAALDAVEREARLLGERTLEELRELASEAQIEGRSKLSKDELVLALARARAG